MSVQTVSATGDIHERVARVLTEILNADEEDVTPGATLQKDLGADTARHAAAITQFDPDLSWTRVEITEQ